ncbi:hypothetical protein JOQ06_019385 [Pogonophryne albipinna]|uniref:ZNRF-3 ectodomain domain-containing protein n=1 Tax=Pogonophryne albipinna TaxID=1090488 RepID=A0AAD6ASW9_9TELE|nr:hypothetical protein JOQ06_019385 [Pogonophryne albipinna]
MRGSPMTSAHSHMKGPTGAEPCRDGPIGQGRTGQGGTALLGERRDRAPHETINVYHPLSLCNTSEDERQEGDFITIVKLEHTARRCLPLVDKEGVGLAQRCYVASGSEPWLWM